MRKTNKIYIMKAIIAIGTIAFICYMYSRYMSYETFEDTIEDLRKTLSSADKEKLTEDKKNSIKVKLMQLLNTELIQLTKSLTEKSNENRLIIRYKIAENLREQMLYAKDENKKQLQTQYDTNRTEIVELSTKVKTTSDVPVNSDPDIFNKQSIDIDPKIKQYIDRQVASVVPMTMDRFTGHTQKY